MRGRKRNGRHERIRTADLYRVNFEVTSENPLPALLFRSPYPPIRHHFRAVLVTSW